MESMAWFCVRTHPRHERFAAHHLNQLDAVEVFHPRFRYRRSGRTAAVEVEESLFPNYVFARFSLRESLDRVRYSPGVTHIVHFGRKYPVVTETEIQALQGQFGPEEVRRLTELKAGDHVRVVGREFTGLDGTVAEVMPGSKRVRVLMEFLGRANMVELSVDSVVTVKKPDASRI